MAIKKLSPIHEVGFDVHALYNALSGKINEIIETVNEGGGGTVEIPDGSITAAKLAPGSVTTSKIADLAVTAEKIDTGAVNESKIANGSVTNSDIATAASIALSKLAFMSANANAGITADTVQNNVVSLGNRIKALEDAAAAG